MVPGGGVREDGVLPSWVRRRLDRAIELRGDAYIVALSAGTTYRPPPLYPTGFPICESVAAAKYLLAAGVPRKSILVETQSWDTIGNAFFSRVIHADPLEMNRLLVITSDFHFARTELAFRWVYGLIPADLSRQLDFAAVTDPEMDPAVFVARQEKERQSLESLKSLTKTIATIQEFHCWLFSAHNAYNADQRAFGSGTVTSNTLQSY